MSKDKPVKSLSETQMINVWEIPDDETDKKSEPEQDGDEVPSVSQTLHVLVEPDQSKILGREGERYTFF